MKNLKIKTRITVITVAVLILAFWHVMPLAAQETGQDLRSEIEALKQGQVEIKKQIQEIKKLIQARPAGPAKPNVKGKVFDLLGNPVQGEDTAKLTLVEFTDYQ